MKKLLLIGALALSLNSFGQSSVKIGDLEIMTQDLGEMNWQDATKACSDLGEGWRLPDDWELYHILYKHKDSIGGFANNLYWSSTEYRTYNAHCRDFGGDGEERGYSFKDNLLKVRAVRTF